MIEAKSNYNVIADDISWLKKDSVEIATDDGFTESTGIYSTTELNKVTNKYDLKFNVFLDENLSITVSSENVIV